ncbi:flavin reductase (DIM6/NTAB) family NADH-FMN oxidoreductase RutF [Ruminococcaceae bacterium R-25]|nr:flavin reductase (DIM6/NTAB) family NADH-FMN oxidoreductase RutF [Ruminococcaceae bacterium R-25]SUQ10954.1 NADH-FMN oxidoreductase RutF, flavin reductase (DIM6/NTAB) family [Oscillospiraceae bacterium]
MAKHDKVEVGISTILNPVPVVMVSSGSKDGKANIMTVAWAGTVNSEPPMVSVSIRKSRYSHKLISETGEFVINLVSKSLCKACDYCGVRGGENEDKFKTCGLTPVKAAGLEYAYAIKEAPVSISCVVKSVTELGSHDMFIGEIKNVTADSYLLDQNGKLCLDNARLVAYNHGEYYLLGEKLGFFGYSVAKEDVIKRRMGKDKK